MVIGPVGRVWDSLKITMGILTVQVVRSSPSPDQPVTNARRSMRDQCDKCYAYLPHGSYRQAPALDMRLERTLEVSHHHLPELTANLDAPNKYIWSPSRY